MTKADAPFSSIFFGLGLIFTIGTYYRHYVGTYYDGEELSYYSDTLREKPSFIKRRKSSDYYQFQLSYSKSKFIIVDNGCSIILNDKSKLEVVNSLNTGDIVVLGYPINIEDLTRANQDKVKAITLAKSDKTILSAEEVLQADKNDKRKYYLIGLGLILCGFISLYLRKKNNHK